MIMKPVLEKFLSSGEVEVLRIAGEEFVLRKITTKQADFLNEYYEYFRYRPLEFLPFLNAIVLDIDKNKLNNFLRDGDRYDEEKISMFIYAICIQALNLRPLSLDYTFSNSVIDLLENSTIMNYFIKVLIGYGYKKSEVDEFSNNKIIRLSLEEMYLRNKADCLLFIARFISSLKADEKAFPLTFNIIDNIYKKAKELYFSSDANENEKLKGMFFNELNGYLKSTNETNSINNPTALKTKSNEEILEEIRRIKEKNKKQPITDFGLLPK